MNKTKLVLGLAGFARTGKDMVGDSIKNMCNPNAVNILKLATPLRHLLKEDKSVPKNIDVFSEDPLMKVKARPYLIKKAQELRENDPLFFAKKVKEQINLTSDRSLSIITDVRYVNEVDYLSEQFDNFEFIVLKRADMKPASDEEERYTTELYDTVDQFRNGSSVFVPELSEHLNKNKTLLSTQLIHSALINEILTYGLPDFSRIKNFLHDNFTLSAADAVNTVASLGLDLRHLHENYL